MLDELLSSLRSATTGDFVYSSLSFYADRRGGELPGLWFVRAIGALGIEETAIRQTLFRMERSGVLECRHDGRTKLYRPSPTTRAVMNTGAARILEEPDDPPWDGRWTLVRFAFKKRERKARDRLRDVLRVEGFASLAPGMYVHPRERTDRILEATRTLGLAHAVHVFRCERIAGPVEEEFVRQRWDLPATGSRYRNFLERFEPFQADAKGYGTREAFALRFALVFEFLRITWTDPDLPPDLLPDDWPAGDARRLARSLYRLLLPGAMTFGDDVMARLGRVAPSDLSRDNASSLTHTESAM